MRQRNLLAGAILSMGLLPACVVGDAALTVRRTEVETRAIEPGGTFHLRNVNGHVSVASGGERQVRIETEKAANSQGALDEVEIAIAGQGDRVEVRTRTPQRRWTLFGPRVRVNYRITLPESAHVDIETVNGSIHVSRLKGPVRAAVVNGGIRVEGAAGAVDARTVNGSIDASYGAVVGEGSHRFATTNGSVSVRLPENTRGSFRADTVNGRISTDLPLDVQGHFGAKHLVGRLGEGGGHFEIHTVNGSIAVKKI
jgi:hypothetical protein